MNKLFLYLIIIGILTLVLVAAWEFYQVSSGAKSPGELTVIEIPSSVLINQSLEDHLKSDPDFSKFIVDNSTQTSTDGSSSDTQTTP